MGALTQRLIVACSLAAYLAASPGALAYACERMGQLVMHQCCCGAADGVMAHAQGADTGVCCTEALIGADRSASARPGDAPTHVPQADPDPGTMVGLLPNPPPSPRVRDDVAMPRDVEPTDSKRLTYLTTGRLRL